MELVIFAFGAVVGLVIGYVLSQKKFQSTQAQLEKVMEQRFENLANRILNDNSQKFSDQSFKHLNHLIEPFKERLKDFEKKVEESYSTERAERGSLRGDALASEKTKSILFRVQNFLLKMTMGKAFDLMFW